MTELTQVMVDTPKHLLVIDCAECGRCVAFRQRCSKCGGNSWSPAGYTDWKNVRDLRTHRTVGCSCSANTIASVGGGGECHYCWRKIFQTAARK